MDQKEKISFVIPCYNSAAVLPKVISEIHEVMLLNSDYLWEVVLVSDASPDNVYDIIRTMAHEDNRIRGIELAKNFGQHAALMAGYRHATGDIIVSLDDDGQTPVDEVFSLINLIEAGSDVVYAQYPIVKQSTFRRFGTKVNTIMLETLMNKPKNLQTTSFFVARRFIIDEVVRYCSAYPYVIGLILRSTNNIAAVEVQHRSRASGTSNYTLAKLLSLWLNGATAFSVKPLRVTTIFGSLIALSGFALGISIVVRRLLDPYVPAGYTSMMAALLFVSGIIMVMLGIMGEYLGRMYITQSASPQYVIRDVVRQDDTNENGSGYIRKEDKEVKHAGH
ncbi:MAG: glycosyltransferase family 2 protein [Coriobacteriia bacterium]|nr:glycosyltransferase family 2 protein [Coriobacteriia bacterium]MCL2536788.1 glycosyltransferase family 2 protein [Coriobacteriia bacterium]